MMKWSLPTYGPFRTMHESLWPICTLHNLSVHLISTLHSMLDAVYFSYYTLPFPLHLFIPFPYPSHIDIPLFRSFLPSLLLHFICCWSYYHSSFPSFYISFLFCVYPYFCFSVHSFIFLFIKNVCSLCLCSSSTHFFFFPFFHCFHRHFVFVSSSFLPPYPVLLFLPLSLLFHFLFIIFTLWFLLPLHFCSHPSLLFSPPVSTLFTITCFHPPFLFIFACILYSLLILLLCFLPLSFIHTIYHSFLFGLSLFIRLLVLSFLLFILVLFHLLLRLFIHFCTFPNFMLFLLFFIHFFLHFSFSILSLFLLFGLLPFHLLAFLPFILPFSLFLLSLFLWLLHSLYITICLALPHF